MYTTHIIILRSVNHEVRVCMDLRTDTFRYISYSPKIFITQGLDPSDTKRYITAVLTLTPHTRSRLFLCRSMRQTGCRYTRDYGYKKSGVGILFLFSSFENQATQTCLYRAQIYRENVRVHQDRRLYFRRRTGWFAYRLQSSQARSSLHPSR